MVALYVPAEHAAHTPPSGPEYPALHVQLEEFLSGAPEWGPQRAHVRLSKLLILPMLSTCGHC